PRGQDLRRVLEPATEDQQAQPHEALQEVQRQHPDEREDAVVLEDARERPSLPVVAGAGGPRGPRALAPDARASMECDRRRRHQDVESGELRAPAEVEVLERMREALVRWTDLRPGFL